MSEDEIARIEALAAILREYDLDAIKVRVGESEIEVVRHQESPAAAPPASTPSAPPPAAPVEASPNVRKVTAPVVGVFYRSATPGEESFVEVGDRVDVGDTLCVLEAMKIFNEITSDYAGVVTRIIPENGELVALGDELFWIVP
ncbi:MAG: acetyl-CoA carboxylase biotin carboxyl carrier protein [Candidatus Eremiobacteraeota bacterium]|nr:acetyl-CoA carboxylase biotin carboxyl carrier protein [Candidatus Eremiobacteraeota bacterium]